MLGFGFWVQVLGSGDEIQDVWDFPVRVACMSSGVESMQRLLSVETFQAQVHKAFRRRKAKKLEHQYRHAQVKYGMPQH